MGPTVAPPELALITVDRARLALQRGDFSEAEALGRQALAETEATEPSIAGSAYAMLAAVALERDDVDEARLLCQSAIGLIDGHIATHHTKEAYQLLSRIEEQAGDLAAALEAARQAADLATAARPTELG
jgi:tetratricopeptide (TPR) repeat protein